MPRRYGGGDRGVLISRESIGRLNKQGHQSNDYRRTIPPPPLPRAFGDEDGLIIGLAEADWAQDATANIKILYPQDCDTRGSSTDTVAAYNRIFPVASGSIVLLARADSGCWQLVAAGCDPQGAVAGCGCMSIAGHDLKQVSGYDATKTQVLVHQSGCLTWLDTVEC